MRPAFGSTQQIFVSPAITPARPGLYCGFASVVISLVHVNNETRLDKCSVAKTFPLLGRRVVIEQVVELLPCLHLLKPVVLAACLLQRLEKSLARFHGDPESALREDNHAIPQVSELAKAQERAFAEFGHIRH